MSKENNIVEEKAVDIIVSPAEYIEQGNHFNDKVIFKVVPV